MIYHLPLMDGPSTESAVDGRLDWLPIFNKVSSSLLSLLLNVMSTTMGAFFLGGGTSHTSSSSSRSPSSTVSTLSSTTRVGVVSLTAL